MEFKQRMAIIKKYEDKLMSLYPALKGARCSGIYFLLREDESGFKYAYIGQSKNILRRLAEHLDGCKLHVDKSLKAHGLFGIDNIYGWKVGNFLEYPENLLNEKERYWIKKYADAGYQLRNKTIGGQDEGKVGINGNKLGKGYYDGLKQGYKNAQKEIVKLFNYLDYSIKGKPNKIKQRKLEKFEIFLKNT